MQQYFIDENITSDGWVSFSKEQQHHIKHVLRMKDEEVIKVVTPKGEAFLVALSVGDAVSAKVVSALPPQERVVAITLIQGMIKGDRWDFLIQKACELGVSKIVPMMSSRTIVRIEDNKVDKKLLRYNKIALEACEQSKQDHLVRVCKPIAFKDMDAYTSTLNLIAYEDADIKGDKLKTILSKYSMVDSISIVIGSEGGFSPEEVREAVAKGFQVVSLGSRILRAETAAMASIQSMMFYYE